MHRTVTSLPVAGLDVGGVLRRAAEGYRSGAIRWGREEFVRRADGCRCALGGVAWAADPTDPDGDPRWVTPSARLVAELAMDTLAAYLIEEGLAADVGDWTTQGFVRDPIELVGGWNDDRDRTLDDVVAALLGAADRWDLAAGAR